MVGLAEIGGGVFNFWGMNPTSTVSSDLLKWPEFFRQSMKSE
jgi:hypothetical protein